MSHPWLPYGFRRHTDERGPVAVDVSSLCVGYGPPEGATALSDVSLCLVPGEHMALIGPNGAGKSTLLRTIASLLRPSSGSIKVFGLTPGACHHRVSYLSQRGEVDWRFPISVRRLIMTGRYVHLGWLRKPRKADHDAVAAAIDALGLTALAERQIGELSGGQQQRALLARALAQEADMLLLDEPFNAVDADTRAVMRKVLDRFHDRGKTLVVATHDHDRLETDFDQIVHLRGGRVERIHRGRCPEPCCADKLTEFVFVEPSRRSGAGVRKDAPWIS